MSNHRYNGDPNHFMGGHPHGQSSHQTQQQHWPYHTHQVGAITHNGNHSNGQMHSPANRMDGMMDNFHSHRRSSYHANISNQGIGHPAFSYNQNHHMNHHSGNPHALIHHASSSSLSTMSPSLSNHGMPSPTSKLVSGNYPKQIIVHDHDVLSGRGVNIAQHPGNQRFRTLITTFRDQEYCTTYSAGEKRAVALQIIQHIKKLDPPGRFLKRDGRGQGTRGLSGPWDELSEREAIKKTCQALRDCNRQDRQGYAKGVAAPGDVIKVVKEVSHIPAKERAARAAHAIASEARSSAFNAISVAATSNSSSLPKAPDSVNETSSTVSMSSSTKRPRDPEANSSTTATTMAETIESSMNFSPSSYHNLNHIHPSNATNMPSRYAQHNHPTTNSLPHSNYHVSGPQYQQQPQQQQQQSLNPYQQIHPHHHNSYVSAYGSSNNQNGTYASATPASAPYFHSNSTNHSPDYPIPLAASQAQLSLQEGLLSAPSTNNTNSQRLNHHQQNNGYYQFLDPFSENGAATSLTFQNSGAHDHQVIKKQRTEDTEPSTGPSENPSPMNGNGGTNSTTNNSNGSNMALKQMPTGYDHLALHSSIENTTNMTSLPSKNVSSVAIKKELSPVNGMRMKAEVNDTFFDVERDNIVAGGESVVDNDVNLG